MKASSDRIGSCFACTHSSEQEVLPLKHRKKLALLPLVLILVFALSVNSMALLSWNSTCFCDPRLAINGSAAACSLEVVANNPSDSITVFVYLEQVYAGGTTDLVTSWTNMKANGEFFFYETATIDPSCDYQMRITVIVDGSGGMDVISDVV